MNIHKHTKIVATIGPVSDSEEMIAELLKAGVNVVRFNMKHADIAWHNERITRLQKVADSLKMPVGILIDLQGPEIRIETPEKRDIIVKKGETVLFTAKELETSRDFIRIPHIVVDVLGKGDEFSIDDGFQEFKVVEETEEGLVAEAYDNYVIKHRKGLNVPGKDLDLPSLIDDDLKKLDMAAKTKVDFVALSFSRTKKDIEILREEMAKRKVNAQIVAKIESQMALDNIDDLIEASDAIMVARGDLGIECPIEQLAYWQKLIITKCRKAAKPVITATQMLQSMIDAPRPTRAEATDVANAVYDGTDAVMLSGESASGKFPIKAVQAMAKIASFNEKHMEAPSQFAKPENATGLVVSAAEQMLLSSNTKVDAIVVFTESGYSARILSSYRTKVPVIAVTDNQKTVETLTLSYGVKGIRMDFPTGEFWNFEPALKELVKEGHLKEGQTIVVVHGRSWRKPGMTNSVALWEV